MKYFWKQYTAWATGLSRNSFEKARITLTAYYLAITFCILTFFSLALLGAIEKNINDSIRVHVENRQIRHDVLTEMRDSIINVIMLIDIALLCGVGLISYFFAGKTLAPIKKNMELQKKFTADASHDLRTPLTIMKTGFQVALQNKHEDIEHYKKAIYSGLEEVNAMSAIVEDLLLLARHENTKENTVARKIYAGVMLQKIYNRMSIQAKTKGIEMTCTIQKDSYIHIHELNYIRALQNIIANAIVYTQKNGTITITLHRENEYIHITISDTGRGIEEKHLLSIFDRFYKVEHSRNGNGGSGLGLSIAKAYIEKDGGTITIESTIDVGTKVIIKTPIAC